MALKNILLRVTGDADDAKRELRETVDDLREFGRQTAEARADIKTDAAEIQLAKLNQRLEHLSRQTATPKVKLAMGRTIEQIERLEAKLAKLGARSVNVDVDVNRRGGLDSAVSGAASAISGGIGGIGGALTGTAGFFSRLGPVITGIAITIGSVLLPAVVALGASFLAAAAGAGALAVAFAGALGPAVLVVVAFFARLAKIVAAVKDEQDNAADRASVVAGAQEQVTAATDSLAAAQGNLRSQTTAAWQAYHDAIETVKDDLLAVESAQIGVERSRLNVQQAQKALRDFQKEVGGGVSDPIKKFTDVDVKFDPSRLSGMIGGKLSEDDTLKLADLILDVREAKLREKQATDSLSDANTKLRRDRQTESRFLRQGIRAHEGYASAIRQVASAQRQVISATRRADDARRRQIEKMADLSPVERQFARAVLGFGRVLRRGFDPAVKEILKGLTSLMRALSRLLENPQIQRALTGIGRAIGSVFRSLSRELGRREFQRVFAQMARGGGELIRILGSRVFTNFLRIMLRIAAAALPELLKLMRSFARETGGWEKGTRDSDKMRKGVGRLVGSFKDWIGLIKEVGRLFLGFMRVAVPEGDSLVRSLKNVVKRWADFLNTKEGQARVRRFFRDLVDWSKKVAENVASLAKSLAKIVELLAKLDPDLLIKGPVPRAVDEARKGGPKGGGGLIPLPIPIFRHAGGFVPGLGDVPVTAQAGEFVLRRSIVNALGLPAVTALNTTGRLPASVAAGMGAAPTVNNWKVTHDDPLAFAVAARRHVEQQQRVFSNVASPRQ